MRLLGIPTVIDRVVQQTINQVLSPIYENQFSNKLRLPTEKMSHAHCVERKG